MDPADKRTARPGIPLSPNEMALIDQARGETPRARWIREAVLEKLDREGVAVEDTAPERPAARAKGTVSPSAMPMTMSRTRAEAEKCFSMCGVVGMRPWKVNPGCASIPLGSVAEGLDTAPQHQPQDAVMP